MKGRQTDSSNFCTIRFSAPRLRLARWNLINSSASLIYLLTAATVFLPHLIVCQADSNVTVTATVDLKNDTASAESTKSSVSSSPRTPSSLSGSSEEDYYYYSDYNDGNLNSTHRWHGQRSKNSKTVQAVVYCSVILISLVGILIKYFVTHYETLQIKAQEQLHYQRLHNQVT